MAGNRLGTRRKIVYQSDEPNIVYILEVDADLRVAGAGIAAALPELFDPLNPPANVSVCPAPKRFKPRVVYIQSTNDGARKEIVCTSPSANLYASTFRQAVPALDGDTTFVTTGRRGEKLTF